jgi:hypothetical protein
MDFVFTFLKVCVGYGDNLVDGGMEFFDRVPLRVVESIDCMWCCT